MRRLPPALLVVVPLALALLYAAAYPLVAARPDADDVVPAQAVVTARWRGLASLDALWCFGREPDVRPSEDLAERHNVPGFPGVDRSGFFHWVLLPRSGRIDPTLLIVPLSDPGALESRFERRDGLPDPSGGLARHAKHLEIRGDYAALAGDREIVRHLGDGGLTLADRGEDFGLAVDVKGAADLAVSLPGAEPWRGILEALGAEPDKLTTGVDPGTGLRAIAFPFGRLPTVVSAWKTARLWAYAQRHEIEIELEPAGGDMRALLARVARPSTGTLRLAPPEGRHAWLLLPDAAAFHATAALLTAAGVDLGSDLPVAAGEGDLQVRALANLGETRAWTLEIRSAGSHERALSAVLGRLPAAGEALPLAAGAAPATLATTRGGTPSPAGHIARSADGLRLYVGADAERLARAAADAPGEPLTIETGGRALLACAQLSPQRMLDILGSAVQPGGILATLEGGGLQVVVTTDGRIVYLRLTRLP